MFSWKKQSEPIPETFEVRVLRRENASSTPRWQSIAFPGFTDDDTAASALDKINAGSYVDSDGAPVEPIRWECSCLQKKCGACAMVICGKPRLACDTFLRDFRDQNYIALEPLRKFPVIADLMVDRSILMENLRQMNVWAEEDIPASADQGTLAYQASRCLQCGCCLEVCPNFCPKTPFFGAAGFVPTMRLLSSVQGEDLKRMKREYRQHAYAGCGKSLACTDICPAGIDITGLLLQSNGAAGLRRR